MSLSRCAALWVVSSAVAGPLVAQDAGSYAGPDNYIYFGLERERIAEQSFLHTPGIVGAQLKYTWKELEPQRDVYAVDLILRDLAFLERHGKRLFVQLQDVSFEEGIVNVPDYLRSDPAFGGGVARQYEFVDGALKAEGWVARRWDPAVRDRFIKLLQALGKALDGRISGINLPETAIDFATKEHEPPGFSPESYAEGVKLILSAAKDAFPRSDVIQYANFMPGEARPDDDRGYLQGIYDYAEAIGAGVGGPDLMPHRRGQQTHALKLIPERGPNTVAGVAVQWGNLDQTNPQTGHRVSVEELYGYAKDHLRLNYLFWGTQEPHYSRAILPFLRGL